MLLLFQISDFFFLNRQRQSCQTGCLITWFKNQTKLLSPVIIFLTDFWNRPPELRCKLPGGKKFFQFHGFPKAWLPFGVLNLRSEFSLKQSELRDCQALLLGRKACLQKSQANMAQPQSCSFTHSHPVHERTPSLHTTVTEPRVINFCRGLGAMSTDERGLGLNFMSNWNTLFSMNMYNCKIFLQVVLISGSRFLNRGMF